MTEEDEIEKELSPQEELEGMLQDIQEEERLFDKKTKEFLKRHRKGEKIPMEEQDLHTQHRKLINQLQKSYDSLYKTIYPKGNKQSPTIEGGRVDIEKIKSMDSSVGAILRKIGNG